MRIGEKKEKNHDMNIDVSNALPFNSKISLVILLTVCHTILVMLVWRIRSTNNPLIDIFFFTLITCLLDIVLIV